MNDFQEFGEHAPKAEFGYEWAKNDPDIQKYRQYPQRQAKRLMKRKVRQKIEERYGMGPIMTTVLMAILSSIVRKIVDRLWAEWKS